MKMKAAVSLLFIACCSASFYGAWRIMEHAGKAALHVRLLPMEENGQPRLKVVFVNTGSEAVKLNTAGMRFLVYLPERSRTSLLHIWSEDSDPAGPGPATLAPGRSLDVGDVFPLVKNLPRGIKSITAVYDALAASGADDGAWHGFVRSPPLPIETAER